VNNSQQLIFFFAILLYIPLKALPLLHFSNTCLKRRPVAAFRQLTQSDSYFYDAAFLFKPLPGKHFRRL
jgi:hypothetical protein